MGNISPPKKGVCSCVEGTALLMCQGSEARNVKVKNLLDSTKVSRIASLNTTSTTLRQWTNVLFFCQCSLRTKLMQERCAAKKVASECVGRTLCWHSPHKQPKFFIEDLLVKARGTFSPLRMWRMFVCVFVCVVKKKMYHHTVELVKPSGCYTLCSHAAGSN